ncbi:uncharacterized protein LOC131234960 [Magnolia sinica]|uniref:uncharacterized protein LOC131234960 n=1 Tax=Magnolia sinica TaxID=86752 RepID=UPI00265981B4|nr:uncharacterized protein LOC131234960 [Magnolia sinica]
MVVLANWGYSRGPEKDINVMLSLHPDLLLTTMVSMQIKSAIRVLTTCHLLINLRGCLKEATGMLKFVEVKLRAKAVELEATEKVQVPVHIEVEVLREALRIFREDQATGASLLAMKQWRRSSW